MVKNFGSGSVSVALACLLVVLPFARLVIGQIKAGPCDIVTVGSVTDTMACTAPFPPGACYCDGFYAEVTTQMACQDLNSSSCTPVPNNILETFDPISFNSPLACGVYGFCTSGACVQDLTSMKATPGGFVC